jgi:branched-chain amino acid transport system ATP-binding protein
MLRVEALTCGYGEITAVRELSFDVERGEIFALIGANGAGKSSTLLCLAGLVARSAGQISLDGEEFSTLPARARIRRGLAIVPEGRRIFPDLSVDENLTVGGHVMDRTALIRNRARVFDLFPRLRERARQLAGSLSGGEQQMLALGRALMSEPKLLLVDELSLGLMPKVVDECYEVLAGLKADGVAILLVEQNTERALAAADRLCVLEAGRAIWTGAAEAARDNTAIIEAYLGQDGVG